MAVVTFRDKTNNGHTTLVGDITDAATTMEVTSFAALGLSSTLDDAYLTLIDAPTYRNGPDSTAPEILEIIKVTAVTEDSPSSGNGTLTITRGALSTTAIAFSAGDYVELRPVDQWFTDIENALTDGTDEINVGAATYNGDLERGVNGVDKTWCIHIPATTWYVEGAAALALATYRLFDVDVPTIDFDKDANETILTTFMLPADYDGSALTYELYWSCEAGTTGDVLFKLQPGAFENDDSLDLDITQVALQDTFIAQKDLHIISASATPTGAADGSRLLTLRLFRHATEGADTFDADAQFIGMSISYT